MARTMSKALAARIREQHQRDPVRRAHAAAAIARMERTRFRDAGLSIGRSGVVHAVRWRENADGGSHPAPACHQGHDQPDGSGGITPVRDRPVSCRRCLALSAGLLAEAQHYVPHGDQLGLALVPAVPAESSFPPAA